MNAKPIVQLPDGIHVDWPESCRELARILRETGRFYFTDDGVSTIENANSQALKIVPLTTVAAVTEFERVVRFTDHDKPVTLTREKAGILLNGLPKDGLPVLRGVDNGVRLRVDGGILRVVPRGYDADSGFFMSQDPPPETAFADAAHVLLNEILGDFEFETDADKARAASAFLMPILKSSNLIHGRIPARIQKAALSGSGKTYLDQLLAAVYGDELVQITQNEKGGVGSLDEAFGNGLFRGTPFIQLDNIRGALASTMIESFATGRGEMQVRRVHIGYREVDREKYFLSITSNGFEPSSDLVCRSLIIQLKRGVSDRFRQYPEGELLDHIEHNQGRYMGCIVSIVKEWFQFGRPATSESGFRRGLHGAIQVCDWIVQNLLGLPRLLEHHEEVQLLMSASNQSWLHDVGQALESCEALGQDLRAMELAERLEELEIPVPGVPTIGMSNIQAVGKAIGTVMKGIFEGDGDASVTVGGYRVTRQIRRERAEFSTSGTKPVKFYRFERTDAPAPTNPLDADRDVMVTQEA